jgi:hypothetical protein
VTYSQELHWRMAAKWNLMKFDDFINLEGVDQSRLVATYETAMQIEAVTTKDAQREANRKGKRGRR